MKKLVISVQCHNFQHRFAWMLSSIREATCWNQIVIDVAHCKNNGNPSTEKLIDHFSKTTTYGLEIHSSEFDLSTLQYRGLTRTKQLQKWQNEAEWMLFADCDMVYHPAFFTELFSYLDEKHSTAPYMLTAGRISNPIAEAEELVVKSNVREQPYQMHAFQRASALTPISRGNVGAGYFQLINLRFCPHGGYYVNETKDFGWIEGKKMAKAKSDIQFRKRICRNNPRQKLPNWFSQNQIHLNHERDNQHGKHLEIQR